VRVGTPPELGPRALIEFDCPHIIPLQTTQRPVHLAMMGASQFAGDQFMNARWVGAAEGRGRSRCPPSVHVARCMHARARTHAHTHTRPLPQARSAAGPCMRLSALHARLRTHACTHAHALPPSLTHSLTPRSPGQHEGQDVKPMVGVWALVCGVLRCAGAFETRFSCRELHDELRASRPPPVRRSRARRRRCAT